MNTNPALNKAFKLLRKLGYFARQNFWCCQSCGWAAVPEGKENKAVFYHHQDNHSRVSGDPFYIAWSGDGHEICRVFTECGISVEWDGNSDTRIKLINY
jgi:hypothetical protein